MQVESREPPFSPITREPPQLLRSCLIKVRMEQLSHCSHSLPHHLAYLKRAIQFLDLKSRSCPVIWLTRHICCLLSHILLAPFCLLWITMPHKPKSFPNAKRFHMYAIIQTKYYLGIKASYLWWLAKISS